MTRKAKQPDLAPVEGLPGAFRKAVWKDYPPIPWVTWTSAHIDSRRGSEGKVLGYAAGANWSWYGVVRHANTRLGAVILALYSVIGFRLTGNGYFPSKRLY